jgi:hypothetical protein
VGKILPQVHEDESSVSPGLWETPVTLGGLRGAREQVGMSRWGHLPIRPLPQEAPPPKCGPVTARSSCSQNLPPCQFFLASTQLLDFRYISSSPLIINHYILAIKNASTAPLGPTETWPQQGRSTWTASLDIACLRNTWACPLKPLNDISSWPV